MLNHGEDLALGATFTAGHWRKLHDSVTNALLAADEEAAALKAEVERLKGYAVACGVCEVADATGKSREDVSHPIGCAWRLEGAEAGKAFYKSEAAALRERVAAVETELRRKTMQSTRRQGERDAALAAKVEAERRLGGAVRLLQNRDLVSHTLEVAKAKEAFLAAAPLPGDGAETVGAKWPPKKGERVKYLPTGEVHTFTGERNSCGGYDIVSDSGVPMGGLSASAFAEAKWVRLPSAGPGTGETGKETP